MTDLEMLNELAENGELAIAGRKGCSEGTWSITFEYIGTDGGWIQVWRTGDCFHCTLHAVYDEANWEC